MVAYEQPFEEVVVMQFYPVISATAWSLAGAVIRLAAFGI
jgi:hypothetical protein